MSVVRQHADWLSLLDISGPFLSLPVLQRTFPQGIEPVESETRGLLRAAYADWLDQRDSDPVIHQRWVRWILTDALGHDAAQLAEGPRIPAGLDRVLPEHHETLRPDLALLSPEGKPVLLVHVHAPAQDLTKPLRGAQWKASPDTRMAELLRGSGVPLGLVTNGERWMLVHAPPKETAGYASWYADIWREEQLTFRAFVALLRAGRFFGVPDNQTLPALLRESVQDQADVTDQLGSQVRAAVQVLVQAFDKLDAESNRALLAGVDERTLYEAALTVMMRLVFLLSAEERKLLLRGDPLYDQHYAVGTILDSLQEKADRHGEEILERACDAWSRLLAVFRAVHGGVQHDRLHLPAYGGTLFDPDRFPFLEGRAAGTRWKVNAAKPLKVNNRVVLHLLRALQYLEGKGDIAARRLSFRGLDIEQIGHVYEGLLDHTARRAAEGNAILGIGASKGRIATLPLERLEALAAESQEKLVEFLVEETERSESTIRNALGGGGEKPRRGRKAAAPELALLKAAEAPAAYQAIPHAILAACDHDPRLAARVAPFAALLRNDTFGRPLVILPGSLYVAPGSDRRSTGTHYTPRSLTEPIVQHTLEPLVYHGPAEGRPRGEWELKGPREILALKICDLAMGSGAFLVAACRYLAERLVESWEEALRATDLEPSLGATARPNGPNPFAQPPAIVLLNDGSVAREGSLGFGAFADHTVRILPAEPEARLHLAARAVADRCLYGVDVNPMAVEMAKLSLWLITVDRERPFTFLDHALKSGDSLLGLTHVGQLERFSLREAVAVQMLFDTSNLWRHVQRAVELRSRLEATPSHTAAQLVEKARLHSEAEALLIKLRAAADFLIAAELRCPSDRGWENERAIAASHMTSGLKKEPIEFQRLARAELPGRRPFHWPLEFPEIFESGENGARPAGFDAFVGNPPFMGGSKLATELGVDYRDHVVERLAAGIRGQRGQADLCAYMFLRAAEMLRPMGVFGLIATNTIAQGDTRQVGLDQLLATGRSIARAIPSQKWPGTANLEVAVVWLVNGEWRGETLLEDSRVPAITAYLVAQSSVAGLPEFLACNGALSFEGFRVEGTGFVLESPEVDRLIAATSQNARVLHRYLRGEDFNSRPDQSPACWVISFEDWPLDRESAPSSYVGPVASDFPACLAIVEERVKPQRMALPPRNPMNISARARWWQFRELRPSLTAAMRGRKRVLFHSFTSKFVAFGFADCECIFAAPHNVFVLSDWAHFAALQNSFHVEWAWAYGSTLESRLRYTRSSCFETFPFPTSVSSLESIGERYHEHRRELMQRRGEGLTKTYNRFHDRGETAADIAALRLLHRQLDVAVAAAYGWADFAAHDGAALGHDFHETKQGFRYTLAPAARREVLDRLLALNHQRHAEEVAAGLHDAKTKGKKQKPKVSPAAPQPELIPDAQGDLFAPRPALPDAAAFAAELIVNLLSEAPGLRMTELARAFRCIADPARMKREAAAADKAAIEAWAHHWQSPAGPERFIPTMQRLAGGTVKATTSEDDPPMALVVAPTPPDSPALREGIRLALRTVRATALPPAKQAALVREVRGALATV